MVDPDGPLRVIFLSGEFPPLPHGGVGVYLQGVAQALVAQGHEAVVVGVTPHVAERREERVEGVRVIRLPDRGPAGLSAFSTARAIRREVSPLLDHPAAVIEGSELSFWAAPSSWGRRSVVRLHGGHRFFAEAEGRRPKPSRAAIERRSIRSAAHVVGVSQYVLDRTASLVGLGSAEQRVIYNGVDTTVFKPDLLAQPEPHLVVFAGTLCEKKGLRHLVRAIDLLVRDGHPVRLEIAGPDPGVGTEQGSYLDDVLRGVAAATRERVRYLGPLAHRKMPAIYNRAAVVALPSLMEAQGIAWVEAMACGRPLLASDAGPGPELIEDGVQGLLRAPTDHHEIAGALRQLLDDHAVADTLGRAARDAVHDRFSLDRSVDLNLGLYREVVERG